MTRAEYGEGPGSRGPLAVLAQMFASFRVPSFRRYAVGAQLAYSGSWMVQLTQSLLVLDLSDGQGAVLGATLAIQALPLLILGPWVGVLGDRIGARNVLVIGQCTMLAIALVQAVVVATGHATIALALLLAAAFGVGTVMEQTMRSAVVVELVPRGRIANAVSLNSLFLQMGRFIGPAVAGTLISAFGYTPPFLAGAALFGAFAIVLSTLQTRPVTRADTGSRGVGAALRFIATDRLLLEVLTVAALGGIVGPNFVSFATLVLTEEFGAGPQQVGFAATLLAVGTVAGALTAAWRNSASVRLVRVGALGIGAVALLAALTSSTLTYLLTLVPAGFAAMMLVTQSGSAVQSRAIGVLRGRISAVFSMCLLVGVPVGAPVFGLLADLIGPRWSSASLGAFVIVSVLGAWLAFRPRRRR